VGTQTVNVTDPLPPTNFAGCSGTTIIPPVNPPVPPAPAPTPTPLLCTDNPNYSAIKSRCTYCASQSPYPVDDCIMDICLSGQTPSTFTCPGVPGCQAAPTPTQTTSSGGYQFATLGDGSVTLTPTSPYCQPVRYRLPAGWEVAPNNAVSQSVISSNAWQSACVATADGVSSLTSFGRGSIGTCPTDGAVVQTSDGCYNANQCGVRILIRKANTPACGNGVLEAPEQCDDGNTLNGDGCNSTCKFEPSTDWSCDTSATPTICYPVSNIVAEPSYLPCSITGCSGCLVTTANQGNTWCCKCSQACCTP